MAIEANNPKLTSWVKVPENSDFPIQNLPLGIFKTDNKGPKAGVAIGEQILDLDALHKLGYFDSFDYPENIFSQPYLNEFIGMGRENGTRFRNRISELLNKENGELRDRDHVSSVLVPMSDAEMQLPVRVRDYTDFYSSEQHAFNVGSMFRDPDNALLPNWKHIPVGYHGRASSIVISGTPVRRPKGQTKPNDSDQPVFGPSKLLDFELEMAFITCKENGMGNPVSTEEAEDYIFGFVLFNDWSARDLQKWEYVPLGPFLAKSFASSISPWIVTMDALEPYRVDGPRQEPKVLPYLEYSGKKHFDIDLEVHIQPENSQPKKVCGSNFKHMYWNVNQQLAHQTVNGCNLGVGDMYASGTISGPTPDTFGSMLEISWRGTQPVDMPDGTERKFILDGDTVIMKGHAEKEGIRIGFGEVKTKILPAK